MKRIISIFIAFTVAIVLVLLSDPMKLVSQTPIPTFNGASLVLVSRGVTQFPVKTLAGAENLLIPYGTVFKLTGTAKMTRIQPSAYSGRIVFLETTSTDTLIDGVNLKLAGNFNGTADDIITLVAIDTFWVEVSRSVN